MLVTSLHKWIYQIITVLEATVAMHTAPRTPR